MIRLGVGIMVGIINFYFKIFLKYIYMSISNNLSNTTLLEYDPKTRKN